MPTLRLTSAKGSANGEKRFPEHLSPTPPRRFLSLGVVCPETHAPNNVNRYGLSPFVCASS